MSEAKLKTVWILDFVARVSENRFPRNLSNQQFDSVLLWLNRSEDEVSKLIFQQFEFTGLNKSEALKQAFLMLDHHLFETQGNALQNLGFTQQPDELKVKKRYRRLQQLFHPDRKLAQRYGLGKRAEQLNRSFADIKEGKFDAITIKHQHVSVEEQFHEAPLQSSAATYGQSYPSATASRVRGSFGSAQLAQKKILMGLVAISILVVISLFLGQKEVVPYQRPTEIASVSSRDTLADQMKNAKTAYIRNHPRKENVVAEKGRMLKQPVPLQVSNKNKDIIPFKLPPSEKVNPIVRHVKAVKKHTIKEVVAAKEQIKFDLEIQAVETKVESKSGKQTQVAILARSKQKDESKKKVVKKLKLVGIPSTIIAKKAPKIQEQDLKFDDSIEKSKAQIKRNLNSEPLGIITIKKESNSSLIPDIQNIQIQAHPSSKTVAPVIISKARGRDRKRAINALTSYVDGLEEGDLAKTMRSLDEVVELNHRINSRTLLQRKYQKLLMETSAITFHFKVKDISIYEGNMARITGDAKIKYHYVDQPQHGYSGLMHVDIKLDDRNSKIIAINER